MVLEASKHAQGDLQNLVGSQNSSNIRSKEVRKGKKLVALFL